MFAYTFGRKNIGCKSTQLQHPENNASGLVKVSYSSHLNLAKEATAMVLCSGGSTFIVTY